jgi:hypothetical protein
LLRAGSAPPSRLLDIFFSTRSKEPVIHVLVVFMNVDFTFHIAELIVLLGVAWRVVSVANRMMSVLRDFPPHRHDNGNVIYPHGFEPTKVRRLGQQQ